MKFWVVLVGLLILLGSSIPALTTVGLGHGATSHEAILERLAQAQIIYLGETHDHPADHEAQLEIIQQLYARQPRLTLALEMFQKPYQASLDQYLKGLLTEAELLTQTEYSSRWGFDWELYAPILRFAKANRIPVLAINTPSEVTRKVAQSGFESLASEDFKWIPSLAALEVGLSGREDYRQRLLETYETHHHSSGNSAGFERFFQAQILWDETMADTVARYWLSHQDRRVAVLVGQGHLIFGDGIPRRVQRRLRQKSHWQQRSVLINPPLELESKSSSSRPLADLIWQTEQSSNSGQSPK